MNNAHPRIAVICTEYRPISHADVIVSRWLEPFPSDHLYGWAQPVSQIVSIYAEQRNNQKDLIPTAVARHGIQCFSSIEKALTLGGDYLAVDGVLLIAEHGDYPDNEFFVSGHSPVPVDRIYRTSMTTALCLRALQAPGGRLSTPELSL